MHIGSGFESLVYSFTNEREFSLANLTINYGRELGNNDWKPEILERAEFKSKFYPSNENRVEPPTRTNYGGYT